jgi:RNA polymerase sigma-70 factor (TIGR02943 family)
MSKLVEWVENYTAELYTWARHKTSSEDTAHDLVQETFLAAAEKITSFKGDSSPKTWLFAILNNKIIDYYRKRARSPITSDDAIINNTFDGDGNWRKMQQPANWFDGEENILDDAEFQLVLSKCLDALPEQWGSIVRLKYITGSNGGQICQEFGISPSNFWQIIHRAKLRLRDCLEMNWFIK